jgi:hypothetical protein
MVAHLVTNDAFLQQRRHPFAVFERKPQLGRALERWPLDAQDLSRCELALTINTLDLDAPAHQFSPQL